ncbi:MAG: hypothetical protein IPJ23_03300 [Ignavibacteriales bacterium]|nr:hypothetical protein [Ignavibacteriales bacterium]
MIFISCSNSQVQKNKIEKQIDIIDMQAWINLMPGGPGSFHLSGEYEFDGTENINLSLSKITVYSENKIIYEISSADFSNESHAGENIKKIKYRFNIQPGLKLNEMIRTVEKIEVKLIYDFDGSSIEKIKNNIYVTRAY